MESLQLTVMKRMPRGIYYFLLAMVLSQTAVQVSAQPGAFSFEEMQKINPKIGKPFEIDLNVVTANGIRVLEGEHLILFTDLRDRQDIEELPLVFEYAIKQWSEFFSIDRTKCRSWKMRVYVMEDDQRFRRAGLMPDTLPPFPAGFQTGADMWVYSQPGDYYTRHLLLHEGTHAFMEWFLKGWGAPWYSEGMAEKLALHQWNPEATDPNQRLKLNANIKDKLQVPYWGRISLIHKDLESGQGLGLEQVLGLPTHAFREVRHYGWAWALSQFLSQHEGSRQGFQEFQQQVGTGTENFNAFVARILEPNQSVLNRDWELFIREFDYGTDVNRVRLITATNQTEKSQTAGEAWWVKADHAWQSTAIKLQPGDRVRISCESRFQVGASKPAVQIVPWIATANGITLEYYRGRPLGLLLAGTLDEQQPDGFSQIQGLLVPTPIGAEGIFKAERVGLLCLRINDSPAKMEDNRGVLEVKIQKVE
jgi:hypothetical protein